MLWSSGSPKHLNWHFSFPAFSSVWNGYEGLNLPLCLFRAALPLSKFLSPLCTGHSWIVPITYRQMSMAAMLWCFRTNMQCISSFGGWAYSGPTVWEPKMLYQTAHYAAKKHTLFFCYFVALKYMQKNMGLKQKKAIKIPVNKVTDVL